MTPATHLHRLLEKAYAETQPDVRRCWGAVLDADPTSADFAIRHAEAVALLADTVGLLHGLPNEKQRNIALRYVNAWWRGLVVPDMNWGQGSETVRKHFVQSDLDHLGTTAALLEATYSARLAEPSTEDLDRLDAQCAEWLEYLSTQSDLPRPLINSIRADLKHIRWLLANAELLGYTGAVRRAQSVTAVLGTASEAVPPAKEAEWRTRVTSFALVVGTLTGALALPQAALDAGKATNSIVEGVQQMTQDDPTPKAKP